MKKIFLIVAALLLVSGLAIAGTGASSIYCGAGVNCILKNSGGTTTATLPTGTYIIGETDAGTTFTIASGCGTPTNLTGGATAGSFKSGQIACAPVINLPTSINGWTCQAWDITTSADTLKQTAYTASSATLSGTTVAADVIIFQCKGF